MSKFQWLSTSEKIDLAQALWDSALDNEAEIELTEAQKRILDERLAAHAQDSVAGDAWNVVKKRILDKE